MWNYFFLILLPLFVFGVTPQIPVKIHFLEALAPKDTTASKRYQDEYQNGVATGKALVAEKLADCGYAIDDKVIFYGASTPIEALEKGQKSEEDGAWLLVGPRRSNHYVLLAKGAPNTPSVSSMATADEVANLGSLHLSISPNNQQMAAVAANEAHKRIRGRPQTYMSVVSKDCITCVGFTSHFDGRAKKLGLQKVSEVKVTGSTPDLDEAVRVAKIKLPSVILVPNYSKVTAQVIAALQKASPGSLFVGGDGWGDSKFGFVQNASDLDGTKGITIRGFPPANKAMKEFKLGKALLKTKLKSPRPISASGLGVLKTIESTADILCQHKPKTAAEFRDLFSRVGRKAYKSPWGVSVYRLRDGDIQFEKSLEVN